MDRVIFKIQNEIVEKRHKLLSLELTSMLAGNSKFCLLFDLMREMRM